MKEEGGSADLGICTRHRASCIVHMLPLLPLPVGAGASGEEERRSAMVSMLESGHALDDDDKAFLAENVSHAPHHPLSHDAADAITETFRAWLDALDRDTRAYATKLMATSMGWSILLSLYDAARQRGT